MHRKGVSNIISAVLVILIVIVGVFAVYFAFMNVVSSDLSSKSQLTIVSNEGYTVYDSETGLASVQVSRGSDEADLKGIDFAFNYQGETINFRVPEEEVLDPNSKRMYKFDLKDNEGNKRKAKYVDIFPVYKIFLGFRNLVGFGFGLPVFNAVVLQEGSVDDSGVVYEESGTELGDGGVCSDDFDLLNCAGEFNSEFGWDIVSKCLDDKMNCAAVENGEAVVYNIGDFYFPGLTIDSSKDYIIEFEVLESQNGGWAICFGDDTFYAQKGFNSFEFSLDNLEENWCPNPVFYFANSNIDGFGRADNLRIYSFKRDNNWCNGADINNDGSVSIGDLGILASLYGSNNCSYFNNWCNGADINNDGSVSIGDLGILSSFYEETGCYSPQEECEDELDLLNCAGEFNSAEGWDLEHPQNEFSSHYVEIEDGTFFANEIGDAFYDFTPESGKTYRVEMDILESNNGKFRIELGGNGMYVPEDYGGKTFSGTLTAGYGLYSNSLVLGFYDTSSNGFGRADNLRIYEEKNPICNPGDENGDGNISQEELLSVYRSYSFGEEYCGTADMDNSGFIEYDEAMGVYAFYNSYIDGCEKIPVECGRNRKDLNMYEDGQVFLISDHDWKDVLSLVPLAVWQNEGEKKKYPLLIYHEEKKPFSSFNDYDQQNPDIYGDTVVWQDDRNGKDDIFVFDGDNLTESFLSIYYGDSFNPIIYGDKVVYIRENETNYFLYYYDLTNHREFFIRDLGKDYGSFDVSEDYVVWEESKDYDWDHTRGYDWDIYYYKFNEGVIRNITTNFSDQRNPSIYGNKIIYQDNYYGDWDIYFYDVLTMFNERLTDSAYDQTNPDIYDDNVVWVDERGYSFKDIYIYNLLSETGYYLEGFFSSNKEDVSIWENYIVWEENSFDDYDVYYYNIEEKIKQKIENYGLQINPAVYGGEIVYQGINKNGVSNIFVYNIGEEKSENINDLIFNSLEIYSSFSNFDADKIINFLGEYPVSMLSIFGDTPEELDSLFILDKPFGSGMSLSNLERREIFDYFSYWNSYEDIVYSQDKYSVAYFSSIYASHINSPLVIENSNLDSGDIFDGKNVICIGDITKPFCDMIYELREIEKEYYRDIGSDNYLLYDPNDIGEVFGDIYYSEKTKDLIENPSFGNSLTGAYFASVKNSLPVPVFFNSQNIIDSYSSDFPLLEKFNSFLGSDYFSFNCAEVKTVGNTVSCNTDSNNLVFLGNTTSDFSVNSIKYLFLEGQ